MALKRPAEAAEDSIGFAPPAKVAKEDVLGANPFAGVSLSLGGANPFLGGSLFASAAADAAKAATNNGFAPAPAKTAEEAAAAPAAGANPFAGFSLSTAPKASGGADSTAATAASSGGGLFSSSANLLSSPAPGGLFSSAMNSLTSPASGGLFSSAANSFATPAPGGLFAAAAAASAASGGGLGFGAAKPAEKLEEKEATGEEGEEVVFQTECKLWKLVKQEETVAVPVEAPPAEGAAPAAEKGWRWQERGGGTLHINRSAKTGGIRLVMRSRGVLKLVLNTPVFPTTKYESVGQKSVRFMGIDAEEPRSDKVSFCSYRLNLLSSDQQGKFQAKLQELLNLEKCK